MSKRKSYTLKFKVMAVETAEKTSKESGKTQLLPSSSIVPARATSTTGNDHQMKKH
jgi:hypothetical protein